MANKCIRAHGGNNGDGSTWAAAASPGAAGCYNSIGGATYTRGNTYYVADGSYSGISLGIANSGSTRIIIKKATIPDHGGIETGWNNVYGDGSADLNSGFSFTTGYWTIDGVTRDENNWYDDSAYGFRIIVSTPQKIFSIGSGESADYITIQYCYTQNVLIGDTSSDTYYCAGSNDHWLVSHCYGYRGGRTMFLFNTSTYLTIEDSLFRHNRNTAANHGEAMSCTGIDYLTIRRCIWEDFEGTGYIMLAPQSVGGSSYGHEIYGNVFVVTSGYPNTGQTGSTTSDGIVGTWTAHSYKFYNTKVHNNTFINLICISPIINWDSYGGTGNVAYNNLFYGNGTSLFRGVNTHDYNAFDGSNAQGESNAQIGITNASFIDYGNENYHLSVPTNSGYSLGSPYDEDMDGITRGADSVWDRGAYEYGTPATLEQEGFRFRRNDGDEDEATWYANQDENVQRNVGEKLRLRMLVNATGDPASKQFQLEVKKGAGGTYRKVE